MRTFGLMVLVVAAVVGCWFAAPFLVPGDDDGLGTGLMAFMILGMVASVVGLWDGLHEHRLTRVLVRALLTGALAGVVLPVLVWLHEDSGTSTLVGDVTGLVPFMVVLMSTPAAVFGWLGWLGQGRTRAPRRAAGPSQR